MNSTHMLVQVELLDIAGAMLERFDTKDISESGLLQTNSQYGMPTSSGLNDHDYQNLSSLSLGQKQLNQIQTVNKIPIPTEILEHFKHIKCHCRMGLFPEIGRAWLTIDSEIYIWTYEQARDVAYYDGLSQLITGVGLVKPKSGVFIDNIKYLLILITGIEIVILGVTFGDTTKTVSSPRRTAPGTTTFEEMQLMSKPIFIINTDSVTINVVKGSANGRIFLGGKDGCLYEIVYQAESSWFGKRCKKVNHSQGFVSMVVPHFLNFFSEEDPIVDIEIDNSRHILYVLTEKGSIEAWDMGVDANNMRRICKASYSDITHNACNTMKTIDPTVFKAIKSICVLNDEDYPNLNIIAVTECGVRLYFSTSPPQHTQNTLQQLAAATHQQQTAQNTTHNLMHNVTANYQQSTTTQNLAPVPETTKPQGLYLRHIRLPPGYTPNTTINKPRKVHLAYHKDGTLLLIATPQQDQDILWSISSAPFPNRTYLTESTTVLPLDGIVWSVGEIRDRCRAKLQSLLRKAQTPKKLALLTNQGAHIIALLKPVDILQQLLMACQGPHHEAVRAFFQVQSEREACATCLLLTCSEQYRGSEVGMWAGQAFMLYGGEPSYQQQVVMNAPGMLSGQRALNATVQGVGASADRNSPHMFMSTPMSNQGMPSICRPLHTPLQNIHQQSGFPLSPISAQNVYSGNVSTINEQAMAIFSAKHDGLYLYVARLLRPIWKLRCTDDRLQSVLTQDDCALILDELYAIRAFLDANSINEISQCTARSSYQAQPYANGYNTTITNFNMNADHRDLNEQVQAEEKRSLTALNHFIKHTCEVLALWKILCEHQFQILANELTKEQQAGLRASTFRDLVLSRFDSCAWLIVALINSYLNDNASVSAISAKLRELCPNLYRHEDAVTFKATEILMVSKTCNNAEEREEKLRTALQLCKDAAPTLPLQTICQQFTLASFYEGVIELCAICASKTDPEEFGIHFYNNDEPIDDREGYASFASRMNYYKEVRAMLDSVYQTICNANSEDTSSLQNTSTTNPESMNSNAQIMRIVLMAVQTKDPILHATVYEWLMMHDMLSELLSLSEPSLGEFLRRSVVRSPENLKLIDLLWKYYEKNGHHSEAARILDNLATMESDAVNLEQRIEYLARAVMCMRNESVGYSVANGVLLKELEDKLEIARVQKSVLDAMTILANVNRTAANAVKELNRCLFDITQLYQNFADPFELWECKLTILNCSHHNDIILIQTVWSQIINKCVEGTGTINERSTRLFTKFENLVREFGESRNCFPLAFLIKELEIKACQLRLPEGTVPEKLFALNLDREILLEYYLRMISMNERVWANEGNEWHLVQSSIRVVTIVANDANTIWQRSKRRILGKAQDILSVCLNLCYQKPGTERMQRELKELQCRMQRIAT